MELHQPSKFKAELSISDEDDGEEGGAAVAEHPSLNAAADKLAAAGAAHHEIGDWTARRFLGKEA